MLSLSGPGWSLEPGCPCPLRPRARLSVRAPRLATVPVLSVCSCSVCFCAYCAHWCVFISFCLHHLPFTYGYHFWIHPMDTIWIISKKIKGIRCDHRIYFYENWEFMDGTVILILLLNYTYNYHPIST